MSKPSTAIRHAAKLLKALPSFDKRDKRSSVVDALTDLRHYCDRYEIDLYAALDTSYRHYLSEKAK